MIKPANPHAMIVMAVGQYDLQWKLRDGADHGGDIRYSIACIHQHRASRAAKQRHAYAEVILDMIDPRQHLIDLQPQFIPFHTVRSPLLYYIFHV